VAFAMALFYFRLPAVVDGSPDVKQFAKSVTQIVSPHETIYVYRHQDPEIGANLTQPNYRKAQNLRPSVIYYLDNPLVCVEINDRYAERTNGAYIIVDTPSLDLQQKLDSVLLREGHYILGRPKELSFNRC
jgi:hypothetical protein